MCLKVHDIAPHGYTVDRATVRQSKTGRSVKFELTDAEIFKEHAGAGLL
jgi:hypothetical protein